MASLPLREEVRTAYVSESLIRDERNRVPGKGKGMPLSRSEDYFSLDYFYRSGNDRV